MVNMIDEPVPSAAPVVFAALEQLQHRARQEVGTLIPPEVEGLRGSFGRILLMIDDAGTRPSVLAQGAWITKQAMGQRVRDLQERGWVDVVADPADGRAVLVRRTAQGDRVRRAALGAIRAMEEQWSDQVGAERYRVFRSVLDELGRRRGEAPLDR